MNAIMDKKMYYQIWVIMFVICYFIFSLPPVFGASLKLAWNANTEPDLAGYRIYYGTTSGTYTSLKEPGNVTSCTLSDLNEGTTYYIAMTAFDTSRNESQKSLETMGIARGAEKCADGIDNDGDGKVDCADADCSNQTCNDNNLCTTVDICSNGTCVGGTALSCNDGNVCTTDSCNPASGCVYTNNTAPCNDGLFCNGSDSCSGGSCSVHAGNPCSGGPACNNTCNEAADNCFTPAGTACADDGNVCTNDICNGSGSCSHPTNAASCDDGNACTTADRCSNGTCVGGTALSCNDGNVCTTDSCNPASGCAYSPIAGCCSRDGDCTDNNLCTGIERCNVASGSCIAGIPPTCDDGNSCTDDACDPQKGCIYTNNSAPCDDNLFCNGYDTCLDGGCTVHSGDPCKQLTCNEETDLCEDVGIICDNADDCSSYSGVWSITSREDAFAGTARVSSRSVTHTWAPELHRKGFYDVSMWWSALSQGCKKCPVEIICNGASLESLSVDQQTKGGQWNLLGTYELEAGSACRVQLKSEGIYKKTCADAVKLVYRGETLPEAGIGVIAPNPADNGEEVYFQGYGTSPDGKSIISYKWVSDRDGEIGNSDVLYISNLSEGKHRISFSVQDDEGVWSLPASETLYIGAVEIICDDKEACTSSTGTWKTAQLTDAFNGTAMVATKKGSYTWGPSLPFTGYYDVYLRWSSLRYGCSSCPVTITYGKDILDTTAVNQKTGSGEWNLLGSYELEAGTACKVILTSPGSYSTVADAVKFVLIDNRPNEYIPVAEQTPPQ